MAGEFTWDRAAPASLVDIDLSVPAGALVAVVGQTGSGKSSLLSAALNLMQQVHGPDVVVRGKVGPSFDLTPCVTFGVLLVLCLCLSNALQVLEKWSHICVCVHVVVMSL